MTHDSLLNDDWNRTIERLGGAEALATGARDTQAFAWGRKIPTPMVLLRLVLAYCLGEWGATLDHGLGHRGQESGDSPGFFRPLVGVRPRPKAGGAGQFLDAPSRPGDPPGADRKRRTA